MVPNPASDDVSVYLSNDDGTFREPKIFAAGDAPHPTTSGNFDGDGNADLAVPNKISDDVSVLLGNGDGTFQDPMSFPVEDETMSLTSVDLDGDNKADLATAHRPSFGSRTSPPEGVSVFLSNGDGTFQAARNFPVAWSTSCSGA